MYGELEENKPAKQARVKKEDESDDGKASKKRKSKRKESSTSEDSGETLGSEDSFTSDDI